MYDYDVIIIGGGIAGLTAAIHLSKEGHRVLVIEKNRYPHHKVCGEYVSCEIVPYLKKLGVFLGRSGGVRITTLQMSAVSGKSITTKLPLGGIGISRYVFDCLLYERACETGAGFEFESVVSIVYNKEAFNVVTEKGTSFTSKMVIGAYGKRSVLDKQLGRNFIKHRSLWLGVKGHYEYAGFPEDQVALHNFKGGYGGLSRTEGGVVNFCYLTSYKSFQKEKNVDGFNKRVVAENPFLSSFFEKSKLIFEFPLTIAQISFKPKTRVENHVLMCGDTAGLIHPLCGNGMAMAVHSAKIISEHINTYFKNKEYDRNRLEKDYETQWVKAFEKRLWAGRCLQSLFLNEKLSNIAITTALKSPKLVQKLIRTTHGKPLEC